MSLCILKSGIIVRLLIKKANVKVLSLYLSSEGNQDNVCTHI